MFECPRAAILCSSWTAIVVPHGHPELHPCWTATKAPSSNAAFGRTVTKLHLRSVLGIVHIGMCTWFKLKDRNYSPMPGVSPGVFLAHVPPLATWMSRELKRGRVDMRISSLEDFIHLPFPFTATLTKKQICNCLVNLKCWMIKSFNTVQSRGLFLHQKNFEHTEDLKPFSAVRAGKGTIHCVQWHYFLFDAWKTHLLKFAPHE